MHRLRSFPDHRALPEGYLEKLKEFFLYGATGALRY